MSIKQLYQGQVATSATAVFTATKPTQVFAACMANPTSTDDTLTLWIGQAATNDTILVPETTVAAGTTQAVGVLVNQTIPGGYSLYAEAGTSAVAVTLTVSGRET